MDSLIGSSLELGTKTLMVCFKSSFPSSDVTYVVLPLPEEHHPPAFLTRFCGGSSMLAATVYWDEELYSAPENYNKAFQETMHQINIDEFKFVMLWWVTKGISRSICSEEESCPYKRGILHVLEKALEMTIRRVLPLASQITNIIWFMKSMLTNFRKHSLEGYKQIYKLSSDIASSNKISSFFMKLGSPPRHPGELVITHVNPTSGPANFSVLRSKVPQDNHLLAALELMTSQVEFNHWTTSTKENPQRSFKRVGAGVVKGWVTYREVIRDTVQVRRKHGKRSGSNCRVNKQDSRALEN
ncbi:hypothetical protein YC2023_121857 [Brassica napus]